MKGRVYTLNVADQYQKDAEKTSNLDFDSIRSRFHVGEMVDISEIFEYLFRIAPLIKDMKSKLFYGKCDDSDQIQMTKCCYEEKDFFESALKRATDDKTLRLMHGVLGLFDEASEMLEHLTAKIYNGKDYDIHGIIEESGDIDWFNAEIASTFDTKKSEVLEKNILKLRKRYKKGFSEKEAKERDLEGERKVLEQKGEQ